MRIHPPERRLRVALFTDSFHETNGVGTLCREYAAYAATQHLPFLCVFGGPRTRSTSVGQACQLELRRGPLAFAVDADVHCDPFLCRHLSLTLARLRKFRPDLVHITGPGDVSILGLWAANLIGVPTIASWHTNLHEYSHRRIVAALPFLPPSVREFLGASAREMSLCAVTNFYKVSHFLSAPNKEMVDLLARKTHRPTFLMAHGVNTEMFTPERRRRTDALFNVGYVGRLTPEKNVRALVEMERRLLAAGESGFRISVVGDGSERAWLGDHLRTAQFTGVLKGDALATAFANMDAFVFPSLTDTFGLVILEAMASGVPVIVNPETGLRAGVSDNNDGIHTHDFAAAVRRLIHCGETRSRMGKAGRSHACARAWPSVFEDFHRIYHAGLRAEQTLRRMPTPKFAPPA